MKKGTCAGCHQFRPIDEAGEDGQTHGVCHSPDSYNRGAILWAGAYCPFFNSIIMSERKHPTVNEAIIALGRTLKQMERDFPKQIQSGVISRHLAERDYRAIRAARDYFMDKIEKYRQAKADEQFKKGAERSHTVNQPGLF